MLFRVRFPTTKYSEAARLGSKANEPTAAEKVPKLVSGLVTNACASPFVPPEPGRTNKSWACSSAAGKARPKAQSAITLLSMPIKPLLILGRGGELTAYHRCRARFSREAVSE